MKKLILLFIIMISISACTNKVDSIIEAGDNYYNGGYYDEANLKYIEALNISSTNDIRDKLIDSYIKSGDMYYDKDEFKTSAQKI